ncbi:MAG TPA: hypothetical protein VLU43_16910 [Anaeromyxobacteraceae bacterium]|nr:hypothetical protein [Anaeromyxobacteraceae bacterium]
MAARLARAALAAALVLAACSKKSDAPAAPCTTAPGLGDLTFTAFHPDGTSGAVAFAGDRIVLSPASVTAACGAQGLVWHWDLLQKPASSTAVLASQNGVEALLVTDVPAGAYQVMASVTDSAGNTSPPVFATLLTSACGALAPDVTVQAPSTAHANEAVPLSAAVTDASSACPTWLASNGTYQYAWRIASSPAGSTVTLSDPTVPAPVLLARTPGAYSVEVTVTSSTGLASPPARASFTVSACGAAAPGTPLVLSPTSRPAVGASVTLAAMSADPDDAAGCALGQQLAYEWSLVSAPLGSAVSASDTSSSGAGLADRLTFTPDVAGTFTFSVVANDSTGLRSPPRVVDVPTGPCGPQLPPISVAPASGVIAGTPITLSLSGLVTDVCVAGALGFDVRWSLASQPAGSAAFVHPVTGVLVPDLPGAYVVRVVATDAGGYASTAELTVLVGACTIAPALGMPAWTVNGVFARTPDPGDLVTLAVAAAPGACALSPALSFAWTLLAKPAGSAAVLAGADTATPAFVPDVPGGTYQLAVVATDASGNASAPAYVTVTASACGANPPFVNISGPGAVNTFDVATLSATATDADALCPPRFAPGPLTVHWALAAAPPGGAATLSAATGPAVSFTPDLPGAWTVEAWATTASGIVGPHGQAVVTAGTCGSNAPVVSDATAQQVVPDVLTASGPQTLSILRSASSASPPLLYPGYPVALSAVVADADSAPGCGAPQLISYRWHVAGAPAGSLAALDDPTRASPSLTPDLPGTYALELTVTDQDGHATTRSFGQLVEVNACGLAAPVAQIGLRVPAVLPPPVATANVLAGQDVQLDASSSFDADGLLAPAGCGLPQVLTYDWRFVVVPHGDPAAFPSPTMSGLSNPWFNASQPGLYVLTLTVSDGTLHGTATIQLNAQ